MEQGVDFGAGHSGGLLGPSPHSADRRPACRISRGAGAVRVLHRRAAADPRRPVLVCPVQHPRPGHRLGGGAVMSRYALQGALSRDLLTWNGKVLVHDNAAEMEFLFTG